MTDDTDQSGGGKQFVYPRRPPYFAMKLIRLMAKTCAAQEIGPTGFVLVSAIVTTEDAAGYRRPVTFFDGQLMPIVGVDSQKALASARKRCIEAGWLAYERGGKARAARYFVTIPGHAIGIDDAPSDEGYDEANENARQMTRKKDVESVDEKGIKRELKGNGLGTILPIPIPIPIPNTEGEQVRGGGSENKKTTKKPAFDPSTIEVPSSLDTPAFRAALANWSTYRRELKKPILETSVKQMLAKLSPMGPVVAVEKIETAIANGWQGVLFESTSKSTTNGTHKPSVASIEQERAANRRPAGVRS